jgi:hypothetical protein
MQTGCSTWRAVAVREARGDIVVLGGTISQTSTKLRVARWERVGKAEHMNFCPE